MDQPQVENPTIALHPEATAEAASPVGTPAPPPLVVVQYRRNWSTTIIPLLLILLTAVLIFQLRTAWRASTAAHGPTALASRTAVPVADAQPRGPSHLASPSPAVVLPPPPIPIAEGPTAAVETATVGPAPELVDEPPPAAEPPAHRPRPVIGFVRPGDRGPDSGPSPVDLAAAETTAGPNGDRREESDVLPPDPPTEEEVAADLAHAGPTVAEEAATIREHREALVGLKDRLLEEDRRQSAVRKVAESQRLKVTIEEGRADFLRELSGTLKGRRSSAGPEIVALCARYGRSIPKDAEIRAHQILKTAQGYRLEPKARVELLRDLGWPEAMILDELAHAQAREIGRRNGPKNRSEALTVAARILLSVPLQHSTALVGPNGHPSPPKPIR